MLFPDRAFGSKGELISHLSFSPAKGCMQDMKKSSYLMAELPENF
jgi:hypothetical protein